MPKKAESGQGYIEAAAAAIKDAGSMRELYEAIHGRAPDRMELQRFTNRLNPVRSNPGADFLGLCVENLPSLHGMTLAEFFGIRSVNGSESEAEK